MNSTALGIDTSSLNHLQPLNSLDGRELRLLARHAELCRLQPGEDIRITGTAITTVDYLVTGEIELFRERHRRVVRPGTQQSLRPLSEVMPRYDTVRAVTSCAILRIDRQRFEAVLKLHEEQVFECEELQVDTDPHAMSNLLQNRCLLALPPDNIETILALMETIEVSAGEQIISQGERDNSYYTVLHGRCRVTRRPHALADEILLAELGPGASFGEEALITNGERNASIHMLTDGTLMRLDKKYFLKYVVDAIVNRVDYKPMLEKLRSGAKLIDVRGTDEYRRNGHGLHIPLPMLRLRLERLSKGREYVFCCNDGTLATTAAFIATQHGFKTAVLDGGLNGVPREYLRR